MQSHLDDDPEAVLADVESLRRRTSDALNADGWQWMFVWAAVAFGAAVTVLVEALNGLAGYYWLVAVPAALAVTAAIERRSKAARSVRRDQWPYWAIGVGIAVVNITASFYLESEVLVIVIWVVMGLGFAGFALVDGDRAMVGMFLAVAATAVALGAAMDDNFAAYAAVGMLFAGVLLGAGVQTYLRYRQP